MTEYRCGNERRRALVRRAAKEGRINGIDHLEVATSDQRTLRVHFLAPLAGGALDRTNVVIEGGVRVRNVRVASAEVREGVLVVTVDPAGDFSPYVLRLVRSSTDLHPPPGYDLHLSAVGFSFKVDCPSDFDCKPDATRAPARADDPPIDYLARDYASFRRLMLDRLSLVSPEWRERNPADLGVTLVETLAYAADHLSYYQDAVATEAYLGTARRRASVRRHARLLDYPMHEGCNARAWVALEVGGASDGVLLRREGASGKRTRFATRVGAGAALDEEGWQEAMTRRAEVFEPLHDAYLAEAHNRIRFHTWQDDLCVLPKGATRATLLDDEAKRLRLRRDDVLVFEEVVGPATGRPADADPAKRHAVRLTRVHPEAEVVGGATPGRSAATAVVDPLDGTAYVEIEWDVADALPWPLCLSAEVDGEKVADVSVARGNVVLADHGRTLDDEKLVPSKVPAGGAAYRPRLPRGGVTHRVPDPPRALPASRVLAQDPRKALPAVTLRAEGETWRPQRDLLASDRWAREFVVEEGDEAPLVRFGDGVAGRKPRPGTEFRLSYRVGNGRAGNVGAESIAHVLPAEPLPGLVRVRNPLPAAGGVDPEPIEQVRLQAPHAFRYQERAVTEEDYAAAAERHREVQKAVATLRWTGSWSAMFITIDRKGGRPVDAAFEETLRRHLDPFRLAGHDLEIEPPRYVPLDIVMGVCVQEGYHRSEVKKALADVFSAHDLPDGRRGFFHPDNFTFGQPIHLSQLVARAMEVPGVRWVSVADDATDKLPTRFRRWGKPSRGEYADGSILMGRLEIARLDNDPNAPENGRIRFLMEGGL